MTVLASLTRVARFRLEQAEQKRSLLLSRIGRLRQSRQTVEADLRNLQQRHEQSMQGDGGTLVAYRLVGMRQIWIEAQERQKLVMAIDEQLAALLAEKDTLDETIREIWSRKKSLERAIEVQALVQREEVVRNELLQSDESWSQMQAAKIREQRV